MAGEGGRLHHLDGIRGIAALCVVIGHSSWPTAFKHFGPSATPGVWVDFFFVLSGFVIAYNYQQRLATGFGLGAYMGKRLARLWPAHAAILVVLLGYEFLKLATQAKVGFAADHAAFVGDTPSAFLASLALVQAMGLYPQPPWNAPAWSISVEVWTYLLFGAAFALFKLRNRAIVGFAIGAIVLSYLALLLDPGRHYLSVETGVAFFRCVAGFGAGVLCFNLLTATGSRPAGKPIQAVQAALMAVALAAASLPVENTLFTLALPPLFGALVYLLAARRGGILERWLLLRPIQFLGTISYSLYISHAVVQKFAMTADRVLAPRLAAVLSPEQFGNLLTIAYAAAALGFGWLVWRYVEVPANDWLVQRLPRGRRPEDGPAAAF